MLYFYSNDTVGAPQLNNQWGDFNKIINYLIDGGPLTKVNSVEWITHKKIKISSSTKINYLKSQTITVSGCINESYNGEYFIEKFDAEYKNMICYRNDLADLLEPETSDNININITACGMERVFGGVSDLRTVIKTKSGIHYRIDDRNVYDMLTPKMTPNNNWLKFARISMAEYYDNLDVADYESVKLFPFNKERPNENFYPDGLYAGQTWINTNYLHFASASSTGTPSMLSTIPLNNTTSSYVTSSSNRMKWRIYANDEIIYIYFHCYYTNTSTNVSAKSSRCYVIGEYNCINPNFKNGYLSFDHFGNGLNNTTATNNSVYLEQSSSSSSTNFNFIIGSNGNTSQYSSTAAILDNGSTYTLVSGHSPTFAPAGMFRRSDNCLSSGNTYYGAMGYPNQADGKIYTSDISVCNGNIYYGTLKHVKWILSGISSRAESDTNNKLIDGDIINIDDDYYICAVGDSTYQQSNTIYGQPRTSWVLFKLKR